ncbi:AAA family ATPase [Emticicia sp. TH156]|uniref:AAA family ATPase n=1 Tax=Emticicia sp. TH156 TaxID=2067454 RepID=UPI000C76F2C4|nr:ATP-binding protein [Emticicia sp. TH156]PLK45295.1 chromosome segregation protein SMC [Emticicia sp. TH156]
MKIKSLNIKNFKSIVDITINEPNPFTVFVGPNGSGKSNIFEALEFMRTFSLFGATYGNKNNQTISSQVIDSYGGKSNVFNFNNNVEPISIEIIEEFRDIRLLIDYDLIIKEIKSVDINNNVFNSFSRLFIGQQIDKVKNNGNLRLNNSWNSSESNLEKVLKRLLEIENIKEEITEWLELFIPEFKNIEVRKSEFSSSEDLLIYQKYYEKPFGKDLISNGTFYILCLLTAVLQSDEPQFLCIEEPENGLNPKVVKEFVNFFRDACEQKGHYIWINTHSQTLVSQLKEEEMIIVDKVNGETKIKQFKAGAFYGMPADEALLTNALGGGIPW